MSRWVDGFDEYVINTVCFVLSYIQLPILCTAGTTPCRTVMDLQNSCTTQAHMPYHRPTTPALPPAS